MMTTSTQRTNWRAGQRNAGTLFALAALLLGTGCSSGSEDARHKPVVVVITLDTTRADRLGCYGYDKLPTSPRLDGLAAGGAKFTGAYSQAAVTPVSHASIFTGLNPYNHGLRVLHGGYQDKLVDSQVTLAEILQDAGYDTGAFVSAFPVTNHFGFTQGFDHFNADFTPADVVETNILGGTVNTGRVQRHAGVTTRRALKWMDERENPFFLWLHYFDPHDDQMLPPAAVMKQARFSKGERNRRRELYDLELAFMDAQIGRVFDKLKELGLWDDCIIVVTSDHGEGLGDHDWWTHGVLYQEQINVPLIIRAPGLPAGKTISSVVRTIDIVPTVGDLLGMEGEDLPSMDGVSLVPLMKGETDDLHLTAYSDSVNLMVYQTSAEISDSKMDMLFALVIEGRWKYIYHLQESEKSELYDLQNDPRELKNLISEQPEVAERAHNKLKELKFMPFDQLKKGNTPQSVIDKLKALGYAGVDEPEVDEPEEKD